MRRSAPSSPVLPPWPLVLFPLFRRLRLCMGGVRGGEERILNECAGSRSSSSSEGAAKLGDVSTFVICRVWKKETSGPLDVVKCCWRRGLMGEDCESWWLSFQAVWLEKDLCAVGDARKRLLGLDAIWSKDPRYVRFRWPELPLLDPMASEKRGALRGELMRVFLPPGYGMSDALEEESESPSRARLRRISSSNLGSIVSRVSSSQPCLALNWARARRFCR